LLNVQNLPAPKQSDKVEVLRTISFIFPSTETPNWGGEKPLVVEPFRKVSVLKSTPTLLANAAVGKARAKSANSTTRLILTPPARRFQANPQWQSQGNNKAQTVRTLFACGGLQPFSPQNTATRFNPPHDELQCQN